ncbi:isoprenoid synthase domain-containing protein [Paraphysoderma sedebokerense]|nr:isoprenoid synthase domain-containing protein [Paraphysoderma sedebokerense]
MASAAFLQSLFHPTELYSLVKFKIAAPKKVSTEKRSTSLARCYEFLNLTSRSFAAVIQELHPELRDAICMFYLILRGLDTVEDDMTIPLARKIQVLRNFHNYVTMPGWNFRENDESEKDRILLLEFWVVIEEFLKLKKEYQTVILDITDKMGNGMADFALKAYNQDKDKQEEVEVLDIAISPSTSSHPASEAEDGEASTEHKKEKVQEKVDVAAAKETFLSGNRVKSISEYNLYCHYVAGLIGIALTRLFVASGLEMSSLADDMELANTMGLFLQKINVTRDYYEDLNSGRLFWPMEIWGEYVDNVEDLLYVNTKTDLEKKRALSALNHMCANALELVPDCLTYMSMLQEPSVFKFCAIPQVMAIATLALIFNNPEIFQRAGVKIRKGLAVKLILQSTSIENVKSIFLQFTREIRKKNNKLDNELMYERVVELCDQIEHLCLLPQASDSSKSLLRTSYKKLSLAKNNISHWAFSLNWTWMNVASVSSVVGVFGFYALKKYRG